MTNHATTFKLAAHLASVSAGLPSRFKSLRSHRQDVGFSVSRPPRLHCHCRLSPAKSGSGPASNSYWRRRFISPFRLAHLPNPVHGEFVIMIRLASGTDRDNGAAKRRDQGRHGREAGLPDSSPGVLLVSGQQRPQHSLYIYREPQPLALLGPSQWHRTKEPLQDQPAGLPTLSDRFHDIGGKERQS